MKIKELFRSQSGISAVEYALLLALIGAGIAMAAFTLGGHAAGSKASSPAPPAVSQPLGK